ncbi:MAG: sulfotransferase domain-containing protein [Halioglobus sp.]|nr:sulfotransferase domain-containing protein [Halioglobus sp.]
MPVDRAYSHYHHMRRSTFGEPLSFWDALQAEQSRTAHDMSLNRTAPDMAGKEHKRYTYIQRGMYIDQLENWLRYFPREQLKLLHYDELVADTGGMCNQVATVSSALPAQAVPLRLSISIRDAGSQTPGPALSTDDPWHNEASSREYLTEIFRPYNRRLFEFLGEDWGWPA